MDSRHSSGEKTLEVTNRLKESLSLMHENVDISNDIQIELADHTARMRNDKEQLLGIRDTLTSSEKKVKRMMGRIRKNKFVLSSVVAVIFLVVIIILAIHFSK